MFSAINYNSSGPGSRRISLRNYGRPMARHRQQQTHCRLHGPSLTRPPPKNFQSEHLRDAAVPGCDDIPNGITDDHGNAAGQLPRDGGDSHLLAVQLDCYLSTGRLHSSPRGTVSCTVIISLAGLGRHPTAVSALAVASVGTCSREDPTVIVGNEA